MLKEKLRGSIKLYQKTNKPLEEKGKAKTKNQQQKRLSSQEFLKMYDTMWREGPRTEYQNPDSWRKNGDTI
jgi:hypothetical protein